MSTESRYDIRTAIELLVPNAEFTIMDNDYSKIEWSDERPMPTDLECDGVQSEAINEIDAKNKDYNARKQLKRLHMKVTRELLKFVSGLASAPQSLKDVAAQVTALEADLKGES